MKIVTTSAKGQIVIPKAIREDLDIKAGQKLSVEVKGDHLELYPLPLDPIKHLRGIFKGGPSLTKELIKERKRDYEREEAKIARFLRRSGMASGRKRGRQG